MLAMLPRSSVRTGTCAVPDCVQEMVLGTTPIDDQIRAAWRIGGRGAAPVVECLIDPHTRSFVPVRMRTDKTKPNASRVVRFAQNAGPAYAACGGLQTLLLRAFPLAPTPTALSLPR
jgi:hypothetical protein